MHGFTNGCMDVCTYVSCNEVQGSRAAIGLTFSSALGSSCKRAAGATTVQSDTCMGMAVI